MYVSTPENYHIGKIVKIEVIGQINGGNMLSLKFCIQNDLSGVLGDVSTKSGVWKFTIFLWKFGDFRKYPGTQCVKKLLENYAPLVK